MEWDRKKKSAELKFLENLRDPDILELLPQKRWNMSSKPNAKSNNVELIFFF